MRKNGAVVLKSNNIPLWKMQKLHVKAIMTARALVIINVRVMGGKYIKMRLSRAHMILVHAHGQKKVLLLHFSSNDARYKFTLIESNIIYIKKPSTVRVIQLSFQNVRKADALQIPMAALALIVIGHKVVFVRITAAWNHVVLLINPTSAYEI